MTGLLIVGHGTRDAAGVCKFHRLVELVADRVDGDVAGGFIELSPPPLKEAVAGPWRWGPATMCSREPTART